MLFEGAALRGQDGVGIGIIDPDGGVNSITKFLGPYEGNDELILDYVCERMRVGSVLLASFRATPETEPVTDYPMIQPLNLPSEGLFLIHNGGVTDSVKNELSFDFQTPLDSEAIIASYLANGKNMVATMEDLSGSFAFVLLDKAKDKLFAVTSFLPLAHSYVRGYGYFYHSDNETLGKVLYNRPVMVSTCGNRGTITISKATLFMRLIYSQAFKPSRSLNHAFFTLSGTVSLNQGSIKRLSL